jgi:Prophage minor tail protein Z (GPZ)
MAAPLVSVDTTQLNALVVRLEAIGREAPDAMVRALNRARTSVLARLIRWIHTVSGIPSNRIRKSIRTEQATRARLNALISLYGGRARLIDYNRRFHMDYLPPSGFKARMPASGHVGYFVRAPGARHRRKGEPFAPHNLPIRELMGPRFTDLLSDVGLADLLRYGSERLKIELEREIAFRESRRQAAA